MSKRFFPQQNGDRKRTKLDVTVSDHNFPLSQNPGPSKDPNQVDTWGDDNDDEILLLASQACEEGYNDLSLLPDYSICMQPASTSTQIQDPGPSTSKTPFTFKIPNSIPPNIISTNLKDKCNIISSPLPGISSKLMQKANSNINVSDDLIFNDKVCKGDYDYRQLLVLLEENARLKSENGKLSEKCVTKEGEASILRTQLKTCQTAVDNARLERVKAQEKVQMEWTGKLTAVNSQVHDLRTQLDFKNLEIISIKEKCRMLESNKVKLTQITVANNDISTSHRNSISVPNDSSPLMRRAKVASSSAQTENRAHCLKLNPSSRTDPPSLTNILPLILEPTTPQHSLLDTNEKLQRTDQSQHKCRIYSTFRRVPSAHAQPTPQAKLAMSSMYEDLVKIAAQNIDRESVFNVLSSVKLALSEVIAQLSQVSRHATTAFHKQMDERYIEATAAFVVLEARDLMSGRSLFKEEQGILARRMTAVLSSVLQTCTAIELFHSIEESESSGQNGVLVELIHRMCCLLDTTSCALPYSGLLLSVTNLLHHITHTSNAKIIEIARRIIASRPLPLVSCQLLSVLRNTDNLLARFCAGSSAGNLKMDYDQGVLLYKEDSCPLQVLWKQIEGALKCVEKQQLVGQAVNIAQSLVTLYTNISGNYLNQEKSRCECQLMLIQVVVYSLRICAVMYDGNNRTNDQTKDKSALAVCRSGITLLYQCSLRDIEFSTQLAHNEGHLIEFCEIMRHCPHAEMYGSMLTELSSSFQSSPEDMTSSFHRQAWMKSFQDFSMAD